MTYREQAERAEHGAVTLNRVMHELREHLSRTERNVLEAAVWVLRDKAEQAKIDAEHYQGRVEQTSNALDKRLEV